MTRELLGETAGVHRLTRWHCDVAVPGVRAADPETAGDWVLGPEYAFGHQRMGGGACGAIAQFAGRPRYRAEYPLADGRADRLSDRGRFFRSTCHCRQRPHRFLRQNSLSHSDRVCIAEIRSLQAWSPACATVAMSLVWQLGQRLLANGSTAHELVRPCSRQSSATSVIPSLS